MPRLKIPAEISRRVYDDLTARIDSQIARLAAGGPVGASGLVGSAAMLARMPDLLPYRDRLIELLQGRQDPETGLITDQRDYECWPKPLAEVTSTLRVLGATLRYPVADLERLTDHAALAEWLASRNWDHPWGGPTGAGHMIAGAMFAMSDLGMLTQAMVNLAFDYIDTLRDETYGVWTAGRFDPDDPGWVQLGGAYYFGLMYERFQRPLPRPEGACRMLIQMQRKAGTGTFCTRGDLPWPHASTDQDALCILTRHARLDAELWREVLPAIEWYARYFIERMSDEKTYVSGYPTPQILAVLRSVLPDEADDTPHWYYRMYAWPF